MVISKLHWRRQHYFRTVINARSSISGSHIYRRILYQNFDKVTAKQLLNFFVVRLPEMKILLALSPVPPDLLLASTSAWCHLLAKRILSLVSFSKLDGATPSLSTAAKWLLIPRGLINEFECKSALTSAARLPAISGLEGYCTTLDWASVGNFLRMKTLAIMSRSVC